MRPDIDQLPRIQHLPAVHNKIIVRGVNALLHPGLPVQYLPFPPAKSPLSLSKQLLIHLFPSGPVPDRLFSLKACPCACCTLSALRVIGIRRSFPRILAVKRIETGMHIWKVSRIDFPWYNVSYADIIPFPPSCRQKGYISCDWWVTVKRLNSHISGVHLQLFLEFPGGGSGTDLWYCRRDSSISAANKRSPER